jgi:hypothetical protein
VEAVGKAVAEAAGEVPVSGVAPKLSTTVPQMRHLHDVRVKERPAHLHAIREVGLPVAVKEWRFS